MKILSMEKSGRINKQELAELVYKGASINDMAVYFDVTASGIRSALRRNGYITPREKKHHAGNWSNVQYTKIKSLNDAGMHDLICAVISQAFHEYVNSGESKLKPIENFFLSEWYNLLTSCLEYPVSGQRIIEQAMEKRMERKIRLKSKDKYPYDL